MRPVASWGIVSGRWGTMEEVADVVVFLASDRASYVNGARIPWMVDTRSIRDKLALDP